jgi:hypothetical protein
MQQIDNDKHHGGIKEKRSFSLFRYFGHTVFKMFPDKIGHVAFSLFINVDRLRVAGSNLAGYFLLHRPTVIS